MIFVIKRKILSTETFGKAYKGFFVFSILWKVLVNYKFFSEQYNEL